MKKDITQWNDQAREIDLVKNIGIGDKSIHGGRKAIGEKGPYDTAGQIKKYGRDMICRDFGHPAEDNKIDEGGEERLQKDPDGPENRLLITGNNIPANELKDQILILYQFFQVEPEPALFCINFPLPAGIFIHVTKIQSVTGKVKYFRLIKKSFIARLYNKKGGPGVNGAAFFISWKEV
jgi:hypothetical protein